MSEQSFLPIAHIAPRREDGTRAALCGAELLGIHPPPSIEYELCETCRRLAEREEWRHWDGPS